MTQERKGAADSQSAGSKPAATSAKPWQLGTAALLLAGLLSYLYWGQGVSQAEAAPFTPHVAVFKNKDQFQVAVGLEQTDRNKPLKGKLRVDLVDADGQVVASAAKSIDQSEPLNSYPFQIAAPKAASSKAADLNVRVSFQDQKVEMPLKKVLLAKAHETVLSSGQDFFAGSESTLRCLVQGVRTISETLALPGAEVVVQLRHKDGKKQKLYEGKTGKDGLADVRLRIPEVAPGNYVLEVVTRSPLGEEKLERGVQIKSDAKILLVSDKPIYQPGQLMHLRALILRPFDMKPVQNKDIVFEVEDSKGNKVFKRTFQTSEYGIAAVDFQLADEVNLGDYHLRAIVGDHRAERTVNVKRYVLPKFKTQVTADKTFYLPKEKLNVSLQTDYFFGKPVSGGKIEVTASTFDVQFRKFHAWEGKTDANGHAKLTIQLPDYFVGQPLQKGNAMVKLDIKVTDTADHTETIIKTYAVSDQAIQVSLISEGGKLVPGMKNRIFAAAIYPDGSPAPDCEIKLYNKRLPDAPQPWRGFNPRFGPRGFPPPPGLPPPAPQPPQKAKVEKKKDDAGILIGTATTNASGLAEFSLNPKADQFRQGNWGQRDVEMLGGKQQGFGPAIIFDVRAEARDKKGNLAVAVVEMNCHPFGENVLLRLDKAIYQGGDTLNIDVRTSAGLPTVYLDIVRAGQVMLSRWLDVKEGQAKQQLDLPTSVFGSLEVHAYQMLSSGEIIRDSRVVYVQPKNDLKIDIQPDEKEYLPGANGRIRFVVTDSQGKPAQAAIGVVVVDEAVYALQEMQPGLEKVYFTLQEELLKPQVQVKLNQTVDHLIRRPVLPPRQQQVAEVLLTSVKLPPPPRWEVNPGLQRRQQAQGQLNNLGQIIFNYALNQGEVIVFDEDQGRWHFKPGLFNEMIKRGQLHPQALNTPLGTLTMSDLARLESGFTADQFGRAVSAQRMNQLFGAVIAYFQREGKIVLTDRILAAAAKQQGLDPRWLKDAWGQPFHLVRRPVADAPKSETVWEIVSAGPDGKLDTKDDVRLSEIDRENVGALAAVWWMDSQQQAAHHLQVTRTREMRRDMFRKMAQERGNNFGGFPNGGFPPLGRAGAPKGIPMPEAAPREGPVQSNGAGGAAPPVKVREYFPETMLWVPQLITDAKGIADLGVPFADSITTWRMTASASSKAGALGGVQVPLKVFQEFFVDIDLPVSLTQSDEVSFPVAVYNYLKTPQTVKLELSSEPWFELLDGGRVRSIDLAANEVSSVKFRIRANKIGSQPLTVKAFGSKRSDAVKRTVEVVPNGQRIEKVVSDRLSGKVNQQIDIPQTALPDASKLIVRIYPGVMAQVLEGVEGMIRLPGG
jgi:5-hydroxyisourate hydrolase-like protein (transthyretin family)